MDRFDSIATFLAVADSGGFSAAARRLGMPLATVSRRVSELEAHLKVRLVNRSTRRITLTESGRGFAASARQVLDALGQAERNAAGEHDTPRGALAVTAPILFGRLHVLPVVLDFLAAFPEVEIGLSLSDRTMDFIEDHLDVAVRIGALPDSTLVAARLGWIRQVICASPGYLTARGRPVRPEELAAHDCILVGDIPAKEWPVRIGGAMVQVPVRSRLRLTTSEAAVDAAIAGAGLARVRSYQVADAVEQGLLALVLREHEADPVPLSLVHPGGRLVPAKLRAFLDFAAARIRARLREI